MTDIPLPDAPPVTPSAKLRKQNPPPPGRRGGFGRQKGAPNKRTRSIQEAARGLTLGNPKVVARLKIECEDGHIDPSVFNKLLAYGYGLPKLVVAVSVEESPTKALADVLRATLTKEERMVLAEITRKALTPSRATVIEQRALPPRSVVEET